MADQPAPDRGLLSSMVATGDCEVVPAAEVVVAEPEDEESDR